MNDSATAVIDQPAPAAESPRSHPFDQAVALVAAGVGEYTGATHADYANMVGPFGGITAAVMLNAALLDPRRQGAPIALTVNFAAPLADGEYRLQAQPVRTNRSTQHWSMQIIQQGEVVATASAVFAQRRETWSSGEAPAPTGMPSPDGLPRAPLERRPKWVGRYDMRFADGGLPDSFDGMVQEHSQSRLWIRDEPPRPLDFASLAAICDSFFPRIFIRRRVRTAIGTVSLTVYFHADEAMLVEQSERYVLGVARALSFRNGYFDQVAEVWSDTGHLLASTHQIVYYRE